MVNKRVDDLDTLFAIGKFKDLASQTENKPRLCPTHNENISLNHVDYPDLSAAPEEAIGFHLPAANFSGCCYEAIDSEIDFIVSTVREHDKRNFNSN